MSIMKKFMLIMFSISVLSMCAGIFSIYTMSGFDSNEILTQFYETRNILDRQPTITEIRRLLEDQDNGDSNGSNPTLPAPPAGSTPPHVGVPYDDTTLHQGGAIIPRYNEIYINQGDYPNSKRGPDSEGNKRDTIKKSGCLDCSAVMLVDYWTNIKHNVEDVSKRYVKSNQFQTSTWFSDNKVNYDANNYSFTSANSTDKLAEFKKVVCGYLNANHPLLIHIKGQWIHNGIVYHGTSNGHFLIIGGYDENRVYVLDPGSRSNYELGIPWEAWFNAGTPPSDLFYRIVGPNYE